MRIDSGTGHLFWYGLEVRKDCRNARLGTGQEQTLLGQRREVFHLRSCGRRSNTCRIPCSYGLWFLHKRIYNGPQGTGIWRLSPSLWLSIFLNSLTRGVVVFFPSLDNAKSFLALTLELVMTIAEEHHNKDDCYGYHTEDGNEDCCDVGQCSCRTCRFSTCGGIKRPTKAGHSLANSAGKLVLRADTHRYTQRVAEMRPNTTGTNRPEVC